MVSQLHAPFSLLAASRCLASEFRQGRSPANTVRAAQERPQLRILHVATARVLTYPRIRAAPTQTMLPVFLAGRHPVGKQTRIAARREINIAVIWSCCSVHMHMAACLLLTPRDGEGVGEDQLVSRPLMQCETQDGHEHARCSTRCLFETRNRPRSAVAYLHRPDLADTSRTR